MPILVVGDVTHPHDHVTVSTYRWQREEETVHGPDAAIIVSIGVWTGGTFLQDGRNSCILASAFLRFDEDLSEQVEGRSGTAKISAIGDVFSLSVASDLSKISVAGSILDSRSGRVEEFNIEGVTRSHLAVAVQCLQRITEWFGLR